MIKIEKEYSMGLGLPELLIILVIVFLVFGAGKLPQVMAQLGKGVNAFKEGAAELPEKPSKKAIAQTPAKKVAAKAVAKPKAKAKVVAKTTKVVAKPKAKKARKA
jgi:sec-independent protein translocase protein TatA